MAAVLKLQSLQTSNTIALWSSLTILAYCH